MISQECFDPSLDFLGLISWAAEAKQEVVRISYIAKASIVGVFGVRGWHVPHGSCQFTGLLDPSFSLAALDLRLRAYVCGIRPPFGPLGVFRDERTIDELIQPVEVDIGEDGANDSALRRTAQRWSIV